jgi:hypothetical protein
MMNTATNEAKSTNTDHSGSDPRDPKAREAIDLGQGEFLDHDLAIELLRTMGMSGNGVWGIMDVLDNAVQDLEIARLAVTGDLESAVAPEDVVQFFIYRTRERLDVAAKILCRRERASAQEREAMAKRIAALESEIEERGPRPSNVVTMKAPARRARATAEAAATHSLTVPAQKSESRIRVARAPAKSERRTSSRHLLLELRRTRKAAAKEAEPSKRGSKREGK